MTSLKPYLIRSIYEWLIDNSLTPYLLVDADQPNSVLPTDFIDNGKIVLNIRPEAIQGLSLGNDYVEFNARFHGKPMHIIVPTKAVLALYAKENGKGMVFDAEEDNDETPPPETESKPQKKPQLKVIK